MIAIGDSCKSLRAKDTLICEPKLRKPYNLRSFPRNTAKMAISRLIPSQWALHIFLYRVVRIAYGRAWKVAHTLVRLSLV